MRFAFHRLRLVENRHDPYFLSYSTEMCANKSSNSNVDRNLSKSVSAAWYVRLDDPPGLKCIQKRFCPTLRNVYFILLGPESCFITEHGKVAANFICIGMCSIYLYIIFYINWHILTTHRHQRRNTSIARLLEYLV